MSETVAIIDYGSGNLRSAAKAFERAAADAGREIRVAVTADAAAVARADRIVLPGVGAFGDCRAALDAAPGMVAAITEAVRERQRPFLGICVGMHLLATVGEEYGSHPGLDWLPGSVLRLEPADPALKIPHIGWNQLELRAPGHKLLAGIEPGVHAYFVHSYRFVPRDPAVVLAASFHGDEIAAMVARDNIAGTQFHPEKSQSVGLAIIANFLAWRP